MGPTPPKLVSPRLALLLLLLLPQSAFALLNIDGTRNQIFVFGEARIGYDSNIFAQNPDLAPLPDVVDDTLSTFLVGVDYRRNAGTISINARGQLTYESYSRNSDRNSWNPSLRLELVRTGGRLTGTFAVSATKASRADSAINLRTSAWSYPIDLRLKYPINEKLYVTSSTSYLHRRYEDSVVLKNLSEYSQAVDFFRIYTSKLDLLGGYRIRVSDTLDSRSVDHNFSIGATGAILPKLNGLVRFGYQIRNSDPTDPTATRENYGAFSSLAQLNWNATRKFAAVLQLGRDFSTTANGTSVDSLSANFHANYIFTRNYSAEAGIGGGRNNFLNGDTVLGQQRHDTFITWDAGFTYTHSDKFRATLRYVHLRNSSNLDLSNFTSNGVNLTLSSRF